MSSYRAPQRKAQIKEKKQKPKPMEADENESVSSMTSGDSDEIAEEVDVFAEMIESLTEKRSSSRIKSLQKLNETLTAELMSEQLSTRLDTLQLYLTNIIRKNTGEEVALACRALSLTILTMGEDSASFGAAILPVLLTVIKNNSKSLSSRRSCVQALGTIYFIVTSSVECREGMGYLEQLFSDSKLDPVLIADAIQIWALLASTISAAQLGTTYFNKFVPAFTKFLDHQSLEVRAAAGEAVALLFDATNGLEVEETEKEKEKKPDSDEELIQLKETKQSELIKSLQSLATQGSQRVAKKDTTKQKSLFREVIRTVEEGEPPSEKIIINKKKYEFVGWAQIKQLAHVRSILGTGLQMHMQSNELMWEIFEVIGEEHQDSGSKASKKIEKIERGMKQKADTQQKDKQRKKKFAFLGDGVEEE